MYKTLTGNCEAKYSEDLTFVIENFSTDGFSTQDFPMHSLMLPHKYTYCQLQKNYRESRANHLAEIEIQRDHK